MNAAERKGEEAGRADELEKRGVDVAVDVTEEAWPRWRRI